MTDATRSLLPARYRKRPVVIEAMQFTAESFDAVREWLGDSFARIAIMNGGARAIRVRTLEGVITANDGDWIVKGVQGEFYPVKADIFEATYDAEDYVEDVPPRGRDEIGI